ncbi:glutathione S-transferase family protein [Lysobacter sp. BMK333-48F3]|uniref:glutathione S-transferase family protein n=1 Tax=Lysobacter sp. BMK333-48F3 TaxID=2867962 RepID=UPI001C8CB54D|nr:glutathione S-transferase family protein [Lysobacter sp. BMK333-48F3]MBX9400271.1 glutathione S-transferase family protein [Lysobacter sp. BMK333-48F3]
MSLHLHSHPLASFCHKVLIALYEQGTPFENHLLDLADPGAKADFLERWPVGKMPLLRDEARDRTVPETSIIIEYLQRHYPGPRPLLPADPERALEVRLWDRFFDLYVHTPMQKIVLDRLRDEHERDPRGVAEARATLATAYAMIERQARHEWICSEEFGLADCAATPALFYAGIVEPFPADHPRLHAYFERLLARPSVRRVLAEARPYFDLFPYREAMPARFLHEDAPA